MSKYHSSAENFQWFQCNKVKTFILLPHSTCLVPFPCCYLHHTHTHTHTHTVFYSPGFAKGFKTSHFFSGFENVLVLYCPIWWPLVTCGYEALKIWLVQPWPVWLSWLTCCPVNQNVVGSISSQGTCLCCRFSPQSGHV